MDMISFVIPCYGSEKTIEYVIDEIISVVSMKTNYDYEVITVNDSSPDKVLSVLKDIAEKNHKVKVIDLAKNFGKHSALMAGFSVAKGDYIVCLDDDGQCPMDRLWDLMEPLINDEADYSMADYPEKKQSGFKNFGSSVNSLMSRVLLKKPKEIHFSNFCAMKRYIIDEILKYENPYPYLEGLVLRTTNRIKTVQMEERDRFAGKGNFGFIKSLSLWINGFTAFSVVPLRASSLLGVLCAIIGFIYGLIVVIRKISLPDISVGWSSTIAIILFMGGVIMLILGLIGEYIGRIYISLNNSPQYVIRSSINLDEDKDE
ncbi:glycosyltransferase [Ruminococcus sp. M6(2020)]|uniref:Glycosyltransferase n=1 Tax=Ruminococcus difficilis TaxID=2763069 RepID=A0A934TYI7_9FIRM|nr:glycosyltransferase [Ruminococcus difficilis]MBK6087615.1 glycosyltransferase [Ruminococcus difficilis]